MKTKKQLKKVISMMLSFIMMFSVIGWNFPAYAKTGGKILDFENGTPVISIDYVMGGAYEPGNVSLSGDVDHTSGTGNSFKMSNITSSYNRVKFLNMFDDNDLGKTFTVEAWAYSSNSTTVKLGVYSATGTTYATEPIKSNSAALTPNEWTKISFSYTHENTILTMVGIDQVGTSSLSNLVYVDDISVKEGDSSEEETPAESYLMIPEITDGHRPIPTNFTSGKDYDDLLYYSKDLQDNEALYRALPEGNTLIDDSVYSSLGLGALGEENEVNNTYGKVEVVAVSGPAISTGELAFTTALRATCTQVPTANPYDFQVSFGNILADKATYGDTILLKFYMRTISSANESGAGHIMPIVEMPAEPFTKGVKADVYCGNNWTVFYFPFQYTSDYTVCKIRLGYLLQTVEIGGYEIINYGNTAALNDMPSSYNAIIPEYLEEDAQWRKEAWDRIEETRKGDINVIVKDLAGNTIPDADVAVDMYESQFQWGTAINTNILANADHQKTLAENFNTVVTENSLKWNYYLRDSQEGKKLFALSKLIGMKNFRGHTLMWDKTAAIGAFNSAYPDWLANYFDDYDAMQAFITEHIQTEMTEFSGTINQWDVLNEATLSKTMNMIPRYGYPMVKEWYDTARATNSGAQLYYNDYATGDTLVNYVQGMIDAGVDFDGVGVQSHYDLPTDIEDTMEWWNQIGALGKRMMVTEYDFSTSNKDELMQASFTRDIMIAAFSTEAMDGMVLWGYAGGNNNEKVLYNSDFTPRKSLEVWQDLIYNKWWTNEAGKTDVRGTYSVKGFYGDYDITVSADGVTEKVSVPCYKGEDNTITVILPYEVQDTVTPAPSATTTPEPTPTTEVTLTPEPTGTPVATSTPEPTDTPVATSTPGPTDIPVVTQTPTAVPEVTPTATPVITATPTPTATPYKKLLEQIKVVSKKDLYIGGTTGMTYTIKPELPSEIAKKVTISYKTSNKKIAEVNQSGKVTAVGKGTAKITTTVKLSDGSSKAFTTITAVQKAGVGFSQKKSTARVGENITFETYVQGYPVEDIYWMTSKREIAVTGKNYGKLKVTVKAKTAGTDTVILYVPGANGKYLTVKAKIVIKE